MTLQVTRAALQTLTANIPGITSAPIDYPAAPIPPELLPLALAWPGAGTWQLLDTETRQDDRQWEEWIFVSPLSSRPDTPDVNVIGDSIFELIQACAEVYLSNGDLGSGGDYIHIQTDARQVRDSGATELQYGGLKYRGFKFFLRIISQEPIS